MRKVTVHQFVMAEDGSAIHEPTGTVIRFEDKAGIPIPRQITRFDRTGHTSGIASEPDASGFVPQEIEAMAMRFRRSWHRKQTPPSHTEKS